MGQRQRFKQDAVFVQNLPETLGGAGESVVMMGHVHNSMMDGFIRQASHIYTLGAAAVADSLISLGDRRLHFVFSVAAGADATVELYEDPTITGPGVELDLVNMERQISDAQDWGLIVYRTTVVAAAGNLLQEVFIPGGPKKDSVGGGFEQVSEWLLSPNTEYILRVTNVSAAEDMFGIIMQFYHHVHSE